MHVTAARKQSQAPALQSAPLHHGIMHRACQHQCCTPEHLCQVPLQVHYLGNTSQPGICQAGACACESSQQKAGSLHSMPQSNTGAADATQAGGSLGLWLQSILAAGCCVRHHGAALRPPNSSPPSTHLPGMSSRRPTCLSCTQSILPHWPAALLQLPGQRATPHAMRHTHGRVHTPH